MNILAIETSCDDTCVALIKATDKKRPHFEILSNIVSSQVKIHKKWGGVYPTLAKREHQKNLPIVVKRALKRAENPKVDLIAVTIGPGLEPCLWVGVNFAKDLAQNWDLPIIPVNHIEAHIYANFITKPGLVIQFPAICLIASGGHTQLILMKNHGQYKILGETRDDAAGECFDKIARILGLGYPGGPAIAASAAKYRNIEISKYQVKLPRPMIYQKNYDFSFSGLKTAVLEHAKRSRFYRPERGRFLYNYKSQPEKIRKSKNYIQEMSAEAQQAVIDVLIHKTIKAARDYKVKTLILGGGVAANDELRKQFHFRLQASDFRLRFLVPPKNLCTDNAVMGAVAGYYQLRGKKKKPQTIEANANLRLK